MKNNIFLEVGVKAFVYTKKGTYLILHRVAPYINESVTRWDIPGGRIKPGEPTKTALRREIKEETGMDLVAIDKILAVQDIMRDTNKHTVRITFLAKCRGNVRINLKEHKEFNWIDLAEFKNLKHDKYLTPVIKLLTNID